MGLEHLTCGKAERAGIAQPGEEKVQGDALSGCTEDGARLF